MDVDALAAVEHPALVARPVAATSTPYGAEPARALAPPADVAAVIDPKLAQPAGEMGRWVEEEGSDLRAGASPLLRRLRKELRDGKHRVIQELRRLARAPGVREHLQEDFVTERGGRPVLALKASARRSVPGIVHDTSGPGQTPFV